MGVLTALFKFGSLVLLEYLYYRFIWKEGDEEPRQFENSLEKADDLCEVGYTFQKNEIVYKKISGKKWFAEILNPDDDKFEIGCELTVDNYLYKKISEKAWTIEKIN